MGCGCWKDKDNPKVIRNRSEGKQNVTRLFAGTPFDIPPKCDECGNLESECTCSPAAKRAMAEARDRAAKLRPPSTQTAKISLQKRKGGRQATVVEGLSAIESDLPALFTRLQKSCGTGGTVKVEDELIELQGNHLENVRRLLLEIGYRVKG